MAPHVFGALSYPVSQACALVVVIALAAYLSGAAGLPPRRIVAALSLLIAAAVLGAALNAGSFPPPAGLRYPGVGVAVLLALPLARWLLPGGMSLLALGDLLAAPLAVGLGIAKIGCFLHGCCFGLPSQLPWAVAFPHRSLPWLHHVQSGLIGREAMQSLSVHPLQLYLAAWSICVGAVLLGVRRRRAYDGEMLLLLLALLMGGWFFVESSKAFPNQPLRLAAPIVSVGATIALAVGRGRIAAKRVWFGAARATR